ncbi:MAG: ABC-2 family transporter protein [Clostridiales bacterium]|nr:ABC-2 family transporter protein [Clostridiales bacterium]
MAGRIKKYFIFAKSGVQTTFAYRGAVFLWFLGGLVNAVVMCLLWWAIYKFSPQSAIAGYTLPQMMMYMILSAIIGEVTFSDTMSEISYDVHEGLIGMRLMKPVNYRAQLGFTAVGSFAARMAIIGIPMIVAGTLLSCFAFGLTGIVWYNVLLSIVAIFLTMLFTDSLCFLFGQIAFKTHAMFGVSTILSTVTMFLSGAMIPLALFPAWAQNVLAFTPFPSIMSMPIQLFLGKLGGMETLQAFGISLAWLVFLNLLGHALYKLSVRHVVVFGG